MEPPPRADPEKPTIPVVADEDLGHAIAVIRLAYKGTVQSRTREALFASADWSGMAEFVDETMPDNARLDAPTEFLNRNRNRLPNVERFSRALDLARSKVATRPHEEGPSIAEARQPYNLDVLGARAFAQAEYRMEWLVDRILVADQPCVVAAPKKGMKTSIMVALAIALATAGRFLGQFIVRAVAAVLFLSGESGGFVLRDTVRRVSKSMEIEDWANALEGNFFIGFKLPSLNVDEEVEAMASTIRENRIRVVMIDPLYLCLIGAASNGKRIDPANLFDMGPLFQKVAQACLAAGATPILIHHFKLTGQTTGAMPELEQMAYSGIQEFARQWILLGRREKFEPGSGHHKLWLTVGGSAGHSGEWGVDIQEGVMDDDFQGREWNVSVKSAAESREEVKGESIEKVALRKMESQRVGDEAKAKALDGDKRKALEWLTRKGPATKTAWKDGLAWNSNRFGPVFSALEDQGAIVEVEVAVDTGTKPRLHKGWKVAQSADQAERLEGLS